MDAQQMYEEYKRQFAKEYGHPIEKVKDCQSVRLYKKYLERIHGVKIVEKEGE